jgi:hypothetical protein
MSGGVPMRAALFTAGLLVLARPVSAQGLTGMQ